MDKPRLQAITFGGSAGCDGSGLEPVLLASATAGLPLAGGTGCVDKRSIGSAIQQLHRGTDAGRASASATFALRARGLPTRAEVQCLAAAALRGSHTRMPVRIVGVDGSPR